MAPQLIDKILTSIQICINRVKGGSFEEASIFDFYNPVAVG